jgi:hypothetical protein
MTTTKHDTGTADRGIGPIGTAARVAGGLALLVLAFLDKPAGLIGGLEPYELVLGLVGLPAASVAVGLLARRYSDGPLRFTGGAGIAANFAVIVALLANPFTASGAALFYGTTQLIAAWRGQPDCEATIVSNLMLGRADHIGCPVLTPIDAAETHIRRRNATAATR